MVAETYTRIEFDDNEKKRIEDAIVVLFEVADCYRKAGTDCEWVINLLIDGVSALKGVLEGQYI